jgi:3-mercaptopyruvate sulfurtransferase SseA
MKHFLGKGTTTLVVALALGLALLSEKAGADPSKYPQYAQHQLPPGVTPEFIPLTQLVDEIAAGKKPMIIDVRTKEEYREAHIKGSFSIPLSDIANDLDQIPKNRLVVFY